MRKPSRIASGLAIACAIPLILINQTAGPASAVSCPSVTPALYAESSRLVTDAGFENAALAPDWQTTGLAGAATVSTAAAHSGTKSLRILDTSSTEGVSVRSAPISVVPGERLRGSAWVRPGSPLGGQFYVEFWNAAGTRILADGEIVSGTAGVWTQIEASGIAPAEAVTANVLFYSTLAQTGTTTYWDDAAIASAQPSKRDLFDASFDEQRAPFPTMWSVTTSSSTSVTASADLHSGAGSDYTSIRTTDNNAAGNTTVLSRPVPIDEGETITASIWGKMISDPATSEGGYFYVEGYDASGARVIACAVQAYGATWQEYSASVQATASNGVKTVGVRLYTNLADKGTTNWDDAALRSTVDGAAYDPAVGDKSVLLVGDERVESLSGVTRTVQPGQNKTIINDGFSDGTAAGGNGRISGSVLQVPAVTGGPLAGYYMWYAHGTGTQLSRSSDGVTNWTHLGGEIGLGAGTVVLNPERVANPSSSEPLFFGMAPHRSPDRYLGFGSNDGINWTSWPCPTGLTYPCGTGGTTLFDGMFDVADVTYDDTSSTFVATIKPWSTSPYGPRVLSVSTSPDFETWTTPRLAYSADITDLSNSADRLASTGRSAPDPSTDLYAMPAIRYGEQYLGIPWVFDIQKLAPSVSGPGADIGPSHLELASSRDLWSWSRVARQPLVTPGAIGTFDYGFETGSAELLGIGDRTYFYYGSFPGEHSCSSPLTSPCTALQADGSVPRMSRIARVDWAADRFVAATAGGSGGVITTRPLTPGSGANVLRLNSDGNIKIEVLDSAGQVISGYDQGSAITVASPVDSNDANNVHQATWASSSTLPAGAVRLRFILESDATLYSYSIKSS